MPWNRHGVLAIHHESTPQPDRRVAFVWDDTAKAAIDRGALVSILDDWTPPFEGHYLYYPSHQLAPVGLRAFVEVLKDVEQQARPGRTVGP